MGVIIMFTHEVSDLISLIQKEKESVNVGKEKVGKPGLWC